MEEIEPPKTRKFTLNSKDAKKIRQKQYKTEDNSANKLNTEQNVCEKTNELLKNSRGK